MNAQVNYFDDSGTAVGIPKGTTNYNPADPFRSLISPNKGLTFPTSQNIKLQAREENFSATQLGNTTHIYTSPWYQDIQNLANYFADWSCEYKINEGPVLLITVQIPWGTISQQDFYLSDFANERWEIVPNTDQKSIITNGILANPFLPPTANGNYVVLPDVLKVAVQRAYENKATTITVPSGSYGTSLAPFIPYAQRILNYARGDIQAVPSYTQTLKRSAVIDRRNTNRAFQKAADQTREQLNAQGTINFIYSTKGLINAYEIQQDSVAQFLYPSYKKQITVIGIEPVQYYAYAGWLVKPPIATFITPNKVQLTQEFLWNEWIGGLDYSFSPVDDFPLIINPSASPTGFMP